MPPPNQLTPVNLLPTRRHINRRIPREEITRLEPHADGLTRHDREILRARRVLQPELHVQHQILIDDVFIPPGPRAHAGAAAGLVGVFATGVELAIGVLGDVEVVVGELGAFVVVGVWVRENFLEGRRVDFVGDWLSVDGVADGGVLNFEDAVAVWVEVEARGGFDKGFLDGVADAVEVKGRAGHRVAFFVGEAVRLAVDGWVDAEREDVLVVGSEDARVDDGAPRDGDPFVDGLGTDDAGGADLIREFTGLVEDEGQNVFVVGNSDDGLNDELTVAGQGGAAGAIVCVFPTDTVVLFVDADDIFHGHGLALRVGQNSAEVVDRSKTIAAEFEIVGHYAGAGITKVKRGLFVEWVTRVGVRDIHVGE